MNLNGFKEELYPRSKKTQRKAFFRIAIGVHLKFVNLT